MKALILGLLASLATGAAAWAATSPVGTVRAFVDAFNKGDIAAAAAANTADVTIIDEVAPFVWKAPGAFQAWGGTLMADAKAKGQSGNKVTLG